MHKSMVYLEEDQFKKLSKLSKQKKRTFASLFREAVDTLLSTDNDIPSPNPTIKPGDSKSASKKNQTVVLGVCGGIAAYKACEIARLLIKSGLHVQVMMSAAAQQFVTPLTFQALTGNPVATDLFSMSEESTIGHIQLADQASAILIAPATADILAKAAHGLCDDIVSTVLLATKAPIIFAPSMNVNMYENAATQENIKKLKQRGHHIIEPGSGFLACGWEGKGRLAEPAEVVNHTVTLLNTLKAERK